MTPGWYDIIYFYITNSKLHKKVRWLHLWSSFQTRINLGGTRIIICRNMDKKRLILPSLTCICDTRNDYFLSIFGHIIIHIRPNRFPQNWWTLWVSRWSEGMTLRLHGCKLRSVHSSSNYTWLIYGIICPICRRMSNFQSNDHLTIQRSNALCCQMKYGLMLDIQRRMKQIIQ